MPGYGLQAAVARADQERQEQFEFSIFTLKVLELIWSSEFKIKQEMSAAEIEQSLSGKFEPFQVDFGKAFTSASFVAEAGPEALFYSEMQRACHEAEQAMGRLIAQIRVRRPVAKANAERSGKANLKRHRENRDIDNELREWYLSWRDEHPGVPMTEAATAAMKIVPLEHRTLYDKIRKY